MSVSQLLLAETLEAVSDGVTLLDARLFVVQANELAREYLQALTGAPIANRLESLGGYPLSDLLKSPATNQMITVTQPVRRVFMVRLVPAQGITGGWLLILREVTRELEIEARMQQQERLAAVGQLAAGIAHDFNNIVASIIVGAHVVIKRESSLSPGSRDRMQTIAQQARRASDLISQILDFSRASSAAPQPFDLIPLLKELGRLLERTLPENIALQVRYAPDGAYLLKGDATRILQALMNLAVNARDAMPDGGQLRIEVTRLPPTGAVIPGQPSGGWLRITVADSGVGIPAGVLEHIFEPFFTTKAAGQGTGLGLSQVYSIVQEHNGVIDVSSTPGAGTTFTLELPALTDYGLSADGQPGEAALIRGENEQLLLVEDDATVRHTLLEALETLNYRVVAAANGAEALGVMERQRSSIQLVLTDLIMPTLGGVELCRLLRQQYPEVQIVAMTGYSPESALSALKTIGVAACLQKPVSFETLARAVREALQRPALALNPAAAAS